MQKIVVFVLGIVLAVFTSSCEGAATESGKNLAVLKGCSACHTVDETPKICPSWVGLYRSEVVLDDGSTVTAEEAYLIESIKVPNAKIVKGYTKGSMPPIALTDDEINALVDYIKTVK